MKQWIGLITFVFCLQGFGADLLHLDPEMTGEEYTRLLAQHPRRSSGGSEADKKLDEIIKIGKRNLDWLSHINQNRPASQKISLSSAATQMAYPLEAPGISNPTIIQNLYDTYWKEAPEWYSSVVLKNQPFTDNPPTTDEDFVTWGLRLDRIYQKASRWILQEPSLWAYAMRMNTDIRGYYFLNQIPDLDSKLSNFKALPEAEQKNISAWIVGVCYNNDGSSLSSCRSEWNKLVSGNKPLMPYYNKYVAEAKEMWDSYFAITDKRKDVNWTSKEPNIMYVPFAIPETNELQRFLSDNIEDEWRLGEWSLKMDFKPQTSGMAHLEFEAGATPHVNGLAGNIITMDKNQPLSEYNVQWTIRHEYGHVIGLPDCYSEFYDTEQKVMINYQLDITNLMCSRRGHLKEIHFSELKNAYFKEKEGIQQN